MYVGDGDGGGIYGAFASKLGSGAASVGKKVAQSEAGRSASRAAIKGATDAAAKDLTNRYLGSETTVPATVPAVKPRNPATSKPPVASTKGTADSDEEYERMMEEVTYQSTRSRNQQKPSVFARFKPSINLKAGGDKPKPEPRRVRKPKEKVYKYALSKEADWDNLPQALALYNFRAELRCDLEFRKGQVIQVMTRTDSQNDWWEGRIEDRVGIFPANYVKML